MVNVLESTASNKVEEEMYKDYGIAKAEGHSVRIVLVDDETVNVPFSEQELERLIFVTRKQFDMLKGTGDFPEEQEYARTIKNLESAWSLLSVHKINIKQGRVKPL